MSGERWLIYVCGYCDELIIEAKNKLFPGHTHHGEMEKHGHSEPVYVSPRLVEVAPVADLLSLEERLKVLCESLSGTEADVESAMRDQFQIQHDLLVGSPGETELREAQFFRGKGEAYMQVGIRLRQLLAAALPGLEER